MFKLYRSDGAQSHDNVLFYKYATPNGVFLALERRDIYRKQYASFHKISIGAKY